MADLDDFELEKTEGPGGEEPGPRGPREPFPVGLGVGVVVMAALVAGVGYLAFRERAPRPTATLPASPPASVATPSPSATPAAPLPALDQSDGFVRDLARGLSSHGQIAAWLANGGLVRTFAAVVANVADGEAPRPHLAFLAPKGGFRAARKRGRWVVDPASYARYDGLAEAVASLDAAGCARVYRRIEPLFDAAYRELGHPEGGFSKALARAIATLRATPVVEGDVPVRPVPRPVLVYEYADPRLEALSPAQKHLLRTGPANARRVQAKLRELAEALGLETG